MRRFIMGTAGHVDHGKTELIKALTGTDTDRLKEEKERGISIELGFAALQLEDEIFLGIIDVPGHERFIKNMVAGAGGIDLALLVIAADESVMPQTREHLDVLQSLAISHGIVVISKSDLANEEMRELVRSEVEDLVVGTLFEGAAMIETSIKTGAGLDDLKRAIAGVCRAIEARSAGGPFRLPVDRVFIQSGIGQVITGSCYSGTVSVGDHLDLLPAKRRVRVRELQSFNEKRTSGHAGERLAIALQGVKAGDVQRGDVLVTPDAFPVSYMVDARIKLTAFESAELKNRQRIRVHHGAREVLGRAILLDTDALKSPDDALVQLRLEQPIVAGAGDHFVIRRYSPPHVLGGGRVIDPDSVKHKRFDVQVLDHLILLEKGDPRDIVLKTIVDAGSAGVEKRRLSQEDRSMIEGFEQILEIEGYLFHVSALERLAERIEGIASAFCREHPLLFGIDKEELKQKVDFSGSKAVFNGVLDRLGRFKPLIVRESRVRAGGAELKISPALEREIEAVVAVVKQAGLLFLAIEEIQERSRVRGNFSQIMQFLREEKRIVKISEKHYIDAQALQQCNRRLNKLFEKTSEVRVGDFKDEFGMTRKHAIPLLEFMDEQKITIRSGDHRIAGPALRSYGAGE